MSNAYLMRGSTCYLQPADGADDIEATMTPRQIRADLGSIEEVLNSRQFDSVPGIEGLRSELDRVERLQKMRQRDRVVAETES